MSRQKYLIISGDDYGLTKGVSEGILAGINQKGISDTNFVATSDYSNESLSLAKKNGLTTMGVHLNLAIGYSCYYKREMAYLTEFFGTKKYYQMVENEFFAQTNQLLEQGMSVSHLTYHKAIIDSLEMAEIIKNLATYYELPVRRLNDPVLNQVLTDANIKMPAYKIINAQGIPYSKQRVKNMLEPVKVNQWAELICHPGYVTEELNKLSSLREERQNELELFTQTQIKCMIKKMGFTLVDYRTLKGYEMDETRK